MQAGGLILSLWHWLMASVGVVLASSFDGFLAGMAYSSRGLRISCTHYWIIGFCTGAMMGISMLFGKLITSVMPDRMETFMGAAILAGLGIWQITQKGPLPENEDLQQLSSMDLPAHRKHDGFTENSIQTSGTSRRACIIVMAEAVLAVFKEPLKADKDLSGNIDTKEAWILSIALGLDALAAGLGASVAGFPMLLVVISALASPAFVYLGITAGRARGVRGNPRRTQVLAGLILIGVGFLKAAGLL